MASPQLEDGFTRIANELLEAIIRTRFPGQELRVMLAVLRLTYGFGKKEDRISYGQLAKITNIPRPRIIEHVKSLVSKKGLGSLNHGTRQPLSIWINKDFEQWQPSPPKETSPNHETIPSPNHVQNLVPITRPSKERKKEEKENIIRTLPDFIPPTLWEEFKEHRRRIRKPMTLKAEDLMLKKLSRFHGMGHDPVRLIEIMIEKGWQSIELDWIKNMDGASKHSGIQEWLSKKGVVDGTEPRQS